MSDTVPEGYSGGPVTSADGHVIGINISKSDTFGDASILGAKEFKWHVLNPRKSNGTGEIGAMDWEFRALQVRIAELEQELNNARAVMQHWNIDRLWDASLTLKDIVNIDRTIKRERMLTISYADRFPMQYNIVEVFAIVTPEILHHPEKLKDDKPFDLEIYQSFLATENEINTSIGFS